MKEWIINNTTLTEEKYDSLINATTLNNKKIEADVKVNFEHPFYRIYYFTLKKPSKLRCLFYNIKKDGKYYLYKDVKFRVLADIIVDKKSSYKKELYSQTRLGTCYSKSLDLGFNLENSYIIIAMCDEPFIIPTKPFLHAFVCLKDKDGKEYILDGTLNIIIEKEQYIKLYNARIITKLDSKKVKSDINLFKSNNLGKSISVHEYLCFPDEVIEGVKKSLNKKI